MPGRTFFRHFCTTSWYESVHFDLSVSLVSTYVLAHNSRRTMRSVCKRLTSVSVLVVLAVGLIGCDSGGSPGEDILPADEAKEKIHTVDDNLSSEMSDLTNSGEAATALQGLDSSVEVERDGDAVERTLGVVLVAALDQKGISPESTGEYSWDTQKQSWVDEGGASGDLILNFPTSPTEYNNNTNNATFAMEEYASTAMTLNGDQQEVPTSVDASLTLEDAGEVFSVNLSNTSFYDSQVDDSQVPKSALLKVLTAPHFHTFQLDSPSKDQFNVEFDLERGEGSEKVLGLLVEAALTDNFDNLSEDADIGEAVDELAGNVELGSDATIDYTVNVSGVASLSDDPSVDEINNQFSATVNIGGQKAGDIKFAEVTQNGITRIVPVIVYPNGDQEPLREAFSSTFETLSSSSTVGFESAIKSATRSVKDAVSQVFR